VAPIAGSDRSGEVERVPVTVVTAVSLQQRRPEDEDDDYRPDQPAFPAKKASVLRSHDGAVMALAFSQDSRLLATGGLDRTVRLWTLGSPPRELASLSEPKLGDVQALAFSPSADLVATGSASLTARTWLWSWRLTPGRDRQAIDGPPIAECLAFSPDGQMLASAAGAALWTWAVADGAAKKPTQIKNMSGADCRAVLFSPDNKRLIGGDAEGKIHFWTMGWWSGRPGAVLGAHKGAVSCLAFSADSTLLATAGVDHRLSVWDGTGADTRPKMALARVRGVVRRMLFLPDGQHLLTAGDGGQVILWHWPRGEPTHEWKLDQKLITSLAIASDGSFVAAGSSEGTVALFDLLPE
jgi:WD40 repeat protein